MTDPGRAPVARTAGFVGRMTLAMIVGLALISCGSGDEGSSPSPSSPTETTVSLDTTVPEPEPIDLTVNVESNTVFNPIPPRFGIELGGHDPNVSVLLSVGSNQIELPGDFLTEAATADGKLVVTLWDDLKEPGGLAGSSTALVGDADDPTLDLTVTEDGISVAGPWLHPFEVSRANPIREAECEQARNVHRMLGANLAARDAIQNELTDGSSGDAFRDAFSRERDLEVEYLAAVSSIDWVYFPQYTELQPLLSSRIDLLAQGAAATNAQINNVIDSLNADLDNTNRVETAIVDTFNATCI